jgi:hypothetical protein
MVDSYPNFLRIAEHMVSTNPQGSDLLSRFVRVLRVISRTEVQTGIQGFMQPFPELQNNLGSSTRHGFLGYSMQTGYPIHIQLC